MKNITVLTLIALYLSGVGVAWAQSDPDSKAAASPVQAILHALQGQWTLSVKFERASGLPPDTEGKGQEYWRTAVGDKVLLCEESWKAGSLDMSILGILWWDSKESKLHALDCNNQARACATPGTPQTQ